MARNTSLQVYAPLGDWWYIVFTDEKGIIRHLPVERRPFGMKWRQENCLRAQAAHRGDVYRVTYVKYPRAEQLLNNFLSQFPTVQAYLRYVNQLDTDARLRCG